MPKNLYLLWRVGIINNMNILPKKELIERIIRILPNLSPKKRRVADFIIEDYKRLFFMSAKEIAQACHVSEPTITRFVTDLGFSGYGEFERYIKGLLHIELTSVERLLKTEPEIDEATTLKAYSQNTINNINNMMNSVSEEEINNIAQMIHSAKSVLVAGYKVSSALAFYFGYLLNKIKGSVLIDTDFSWNVLDHIALHGKSVLLFVIAFPRYPRKTIELIEYAKKFNVKVIGLSDTPKSPVISLSDEYVIIDLEGLSFVDPFSHIMTFLSALVHKIAFVDRSASLERLSRIEEGLRKRKAFYSLENGDGKVYDPLVSTRFFAHGNETGAAK